MTLGIAMTSLAQKKFGYGVEAGWNISYPVDATTAAYGFRVGVFGDMRLSNHFALDAALRLNYKPWKAKDNYMCSPAQGEPFIRTTRVSVGNPFVLELPVHAVCDFRLGPGVRMNIALGPYVGVGLFGHQNEKVTYHRQSGKETVTTMDCNVYEDNEFGFRRFEFGVDCRLGIEIRNHYLVNLSYLQQLNPQSDSHILPIDMSRAFTLGIGYRF